MFSQAQYIGSHALNFSPGLWSNVAQNGPREPWVTQSFQYLVSKHYPRNLVSIFLGKPKSVRAWKSSITYLQLFLQFNPLLNGLSLSALSSANLFACLLWGYCKNSFCIRTTTVLDCKSFNRLVSTRCKFYPPLSTAWWPSWIHRWRPSRVSSSSPPPSLDARPPVGVSCEAYTQPITGWTQPDIA